MSRKILTYGNDNNPNEIVKVIIYLNEVNKLNSPLEYSDKNNHGVLAERTRQT